MSVLVGSHLVGKRASNTPEYLDQYYTYILVSNINLARVYVSPAYDVALLAEKKEWIIKLAQVFIGEVIKVGLQVNEEKTML